MLRLVDVVIQRSRPIAERPGQEPKNIPRTDPKRGIGHTQCSALACSLDFVRCASGLCWYDRNVIRSTGNGSGDFGRETVAGPRFVMPAVRTIEVAGLVSGTTGFLSLPFGDLLGGGSVVPCAHQCAS